MVKITNVSKGEASPLVVTAFVFFAIILVLILILSVFKDFGGFVNYVASVFKLQIRLP